MLDRTHALGSASQDDIASLQRHAAAQIGYQLVNREDHVLRVPSLLLHSFFSNGVNNKQTLSKAAHTRTETQANH